MAATNHCPECGAALATDETCESKFHALLNREWEIAQDDPDFFNSSAGLTAHFFAVSCYAIQHPQSMGYTVAALLAARENLEAHLNGEASITAVRAKVSQSAEAKGRVLRREGEPVHDWGVTHWPMTAEDVLAAPAEDYAQATKQWAKATLEAIAKADQKRVRDVQHPSSRI